MISSNGNLYLIDWKPLVKNLGFLFISIGIVSFIYRVLIIQEENKKATQLIELVSKEVKQRLLHNQNILDSGLIRVEEKVNEQGETRKAFGEYLVLNTYIPNYLGQQTALRLRINEGEMKRINIHLLDAGDDKPGLLLLELRAGTLDGDFGFYRSEILNNYKQIWKIGKDLSKGIINGTSLREFNLYLYNILPTIYAMKFSPDEVYMTFFLFGIKASNCPQIVVDTNNPNSQLNKCFQNHIKELRDHFGTVRFDLLIKEDLDKFKRYIDAIEKYVKA